MEIWKTLERIPFYEVSSLGNVRSIRTKKLLKPASNQYGHKIVCLWDGRKRHTSYVHRLVGELFLEEINLGLTINHLDKDPRNNSIENLEWVSYKENARHKQDPHRYMLFKKLANITNSMTNEELEQFLSRAS